jgi:hypothetical protein
MVDSPPFVAAVDGVAASGDLLVFLLVGLLAGVHCLGMCGPLVTVYADRFNRGSDAGGRAGLSWYEARQHGLFNLGRATSYGLLGGFFGLLGASTFASVDAVSTGGDSVRGVVGIAVGLVIIWSGLSYVRGGSGVGHSVPIFGAAFGRLTGALVGRVDRWASTPRIFGLGAVHGLLPCPIIYPAYLAVFALGEPVRGALLLAVLGLGTIPTLFLYGTALGSISPATRTQLHRVLGVSFLVLGYIPLQHGLMLYGIHLPHPSVPFYQPLS